MTENEFKKVIWQKNDYLINHCGYYPDKKFFQTKDDDSGTSNDFYIDTEALKDWAYKISQCYIPFNNDHALLMKDLLERRNGQYSNGTLYSSSRFVAELFKDARNRSQLLTQLGFINNHDGFNWHLEYRLPIFDSEKEHPAQLDLAIVNETDKIFIGVESKMKEIYSNHHNDFKESYRSKLNELGANLFEFSEGSKDSPIRVGLNNSTVPEYCNFYYKQQICHLLGLKKYKECNDNYRCLFMNLVFDISAIPGYEGEEHIVEYKQNEKAIMRILEPVFNQNGIEYCGLKTQEDFDK